MVMLEIEIKVEVTVRIDMVVVEAHCKQEDGQGRKTADITWLSVVYTPHGRR